MSSSEGLTPEGDGFVHKYGKYNIILHTAWSCA
jgi:hypothetical protein